MIHILRNFFLSIVKSNILELKWKILSIVARAGFTKMFYQIIQSIISLFKEDFLLVFRKTGRERKRNIDSRV